MAFARRYTLWIKGDRETAIAAMKAHGIRGWTKGGEREVKEYTIVDLVANVASEARVHAWFAEPSPSGCVYPPGALMLFRRDADVGDAMTEVL